MKWKFKIYSKLDHGKNIHWLYSQWYAVKIALEMKRLKGKKSWMWKSRFVDSCVKIINDKSKSGFLKKIWIILCLLLEQYFNIAELVAYIFLQSVLIIMQCYDIIRETKYVTVLTDKKLKQSLKGLDFGQYLE